MSKAAQTLSLRGFTFAMVVAELKVLNVKRAIVEEKISYNYHTPHINIYVALGHRPIVEVWIEESKMVGTRINVRSLAWWKCWFKRFQHISIVGEIGQ